MIMLGIGNAMNCMQASFMIYVAGVQVRKE